ncbi:MAG: flagellar hook-length control protein FliK [Ferrovibrio sp.]|uniref:flagellar hook-length control protein FliK n=1 Tax=Ferrovibrio sp. TaxID=1917215 RepID=UPI002624569F|nr:flagellar hook-length control protein FliK [Ferrovibrio sp.]MCW0235624.1 flagellar hook-length control protein FliK [Ferrovibrio sp.]
MQVAQVNSSVASALGQTPAEDSSSRADDFARVLQNAFYGKGSEAVAKTSERAMSEAAPRTETRTETRREPGPDSRPAERISYERSEPVDTRRNDEPAPRETQPSSKPAEDKAPARPDAKPAAKDAAPPREVRQDADKTEDAAAQDETKDTAKPADQAAAPVADDTADTAEDVLSEDATKPAVAVVPDDLLILSLLQTQVAPVAAPAAAPAVAQSGEIPAVVPAATAAVPAVNPVDAAAAALLAAAEALQSETPAPVQPDAAAAKAAVVATAADTAVVPAAPQPAVAVAVDTTAMGKTATDTSAAALLSQQQAVTPEDFAVIQQALTAQTQVQAQAGKPVVTAEASPKTEAKADKTLTVDLQSATTTVAPKTLVDQASLFAMQGDDDQAAADAALLQQQTLTAQQPAQPGGPELKFNAALLLANAEAQLQGNAAAATGNSQTGQQQVAPMSSTGAPVVQAAQHAATHAATRHLNTYIPADEQVALQIKKGAAEGVDKISIKLDPGNLGKVEVKLEVTHDGRLMAVISADKPETLHMLQQEAGKLEQSLRDAGLKTDQQSLSFSLRDQGQANEGRDGNGNGNGRQRNRGGDDYAEAGLRTDPVQVAAANAQRAAAARGGLDIRI